MLSQLFGSVMVSVLGYSASYALAHIMLGIPLW